MSAPKPVRQFVPLPGQEYATPVPPYNKPTVDLYGKQKLNLTPEELQEFSKPKVLISGGGIGGLTLALLLYKANIPFLVLERAKEIKPLELYDLLFNSIPRERILLGKRVLSLQQNEDSVMVRCSDNTSYYGDILVGSDGAYSAVRQNLYKDLKVGKKLPASDGVALPFNCVCLVGQTVPLDPEEFPLMKNELSQCDAVLGVSTMCTRNDSFRNSEWGPEAAEALAREVRPFKAAGGKDGRVLTLGDYIDKTPQHLMSKVMLEEIVFDTWYGGRTVLLGDACHKMSPAGGVGAIIAIHDAVTLANWISTLRFATVEDIGKAFKDYRAERYPVAKEAFESSQMFIQNLGKNVRASLVRGLIKRLPHWLWRRIILKKVAARSQASFLPQVEDIAKKAKRSYQPSLHKTLAIHKERSLNPSTAATGSHAPVTV
ncbi:hypothetical protein BGZ82_000234 [Podila clonocystis]|nr:hypothetical protein BGZ82_000234 [Podila clonocystis]